MTQMGPLVLSGKGVVSGGLTFKNRGHWGSRYIYIYISIYIYKYIYICNIIYNIYIYIFLCFSKPFFGGIHMDSMWNFQV